MSLRASSICTKKEERPGDTPLFIALNTNVINQFLRLWLHLISRFIYFPPVLRC